MECDCGAKENEPCMTACSLWTVEEEEPIPLSVLKAETDIDEDEFFVADLLSEKIIESYFSKMLCHATFMVRQSNPNKSKDECSEEALRILHSILEKVK